MCLLCFRTKAKEAEQHLEEEIKQREKAEADAYNLRFVLKQQAHKIKNFEQKFQSSLVETLEKKVNSLRAEIRKMKTNDTRQSREFCSVFKCFVYRIL